MNFIREYIDKSHGIDRLRIFCYSCYFTIAIFSNNEGFILSKICRLHHLNP